MTRPTVGGLQVVVVLAALTLAMCVLVPSSDAAPPRAVAGSDAAAQELLQRAVLAESATVYQGVELMSVVDDGAGPQGTNEAEATQVVTVTHLPGEGTVLVETAADGTATRAAFSAAAGGEDSARPNVLLGLLDRTYQLRFGDSAVVAGRNTRQVVARRPDGTVAARFWIDAATGLLLRRDLLARDGRVVRHSEFVRLTLAATSPRHLPVMLPAVTGHTLSDSDLDTWAGRGWPCPRQLAGLSLFDARSESGDGGPVLHLTYSDGLSTVSLFVQPGTLDPAGLAQTSAATVAGQAVRLRSGMPRGVVWSGQGYVFTVVADAPSDTVEALVAALPHTQADDGGLSRIGRGLGRLVSWLNPFG